MTVLSWVIATALLCFVSVDALYESEVGTFDWRQKFVGKVIFNQFDQERAQIIVATDDGVVAAVSSETGELNWRQTMRPFDSIDYMAFVLNVLITVCDNGSKIQRWNLASGQQSHITNHHATPIRLSSGTDMKGDKASSAGLAVDPWQSYTSARIIDPRAGVLGLLSQDLFVFYRIDNLVELSRYDFAGEDAPADKPTIFRDFTMLRVSGFIAAVGYLAPDDLDSRGVFLVKVLDRAGGVRNSVNITAPQFSGTPVCQVVRGYIICLDQSTTMFFADLGERGESVSFMETQLPGSGSVSFASMDTSAHSNAPCVALSFSDGTNAVYRLLPQSSGDSNATVLPLGSALSGYAVYAESVSSSEVTIVSATASDATLRLSAHNLVGDTVRLDHDTIKLTDSMGKVAAVFADLDTDGALCAVIRMEDCTLLYVAEGVVKWKRNEALAYIKSAVFADVPASIIASESLPAAGGVIGAIVSRTARHLANIPHALNSIFSAGPAKTSHELVRDPFNLRKILVVAAAGGKILGLDTADGSVIWSYYPEGGLGSDPKIFEVLSTAHADPRVVVFGHAVGQSGWVSVEIDTLTGVATTSPSGSSAVVEVAVASSAAVADRTVLLLLDSTGRAQVYPPTAAAVTAVEATGQKLYFYTVDRSTGEIIGRVAGKRESPDDTSFPTTPVWNIALGKPIAAVAGKRRPFQRAGSLGVVLGDRSVMHKYLNPHTIAVATMSEYSKGSATLTVRVIDTVRGAVLNKVFHENCYDTVHMIHAENFVIYHYRNRKDKRYEVGVIEMFDGTGRDPTAPYESLALATRPPIFLKQSFIFPSAITSLAVTRTQRGITDLAVLATLSTGDIAMVPRSMFDARRPTNEKAAKHVEGSGLMPYHPIIPLNPLMYLNYNQSISRAREVFTGTSGLESTCLVLVAGTDVFFTFARPSRKYDALYDDFPYAMTVVALVGMATGIFYIKSRSDAAALQRIWK